MSSEDFTDFIPCEICDEPILFNDYYSHVVGCNTRQLLRQQDLSQSFNTLSALLGEISNLGTTQQGANIFQNPILTFPPTHDPESTNPESPVNEEILDVEADAHAEEEAEEEADADEIPQFVGNITSRNLVSLLSNFSNRPLEIGDLMSGFYNIVSRNLNDPLVELEDVPVGLTTVQKQKCLTEKAVQITNTDLEHKDPICLICCDEEPVTTLTEMICGHKMCKKCADTHFTKNVKCPFCNQDLRDLLEAKEKCETEPGIETESQAKENSKSETETENVAG